MPGQTVQIRTADGQMPAHLARPAGAGPFPGVIVWMEAFGLNDHIKSVADRIGMTGFCMGGRVTFLAATRFPIQAAAPFYGGGIAGLLKGADGIRCPMVLFFGEKDGFIPLADVDKIRERLEALGKEAEVVVYPGADHGFFCDERPSYQAAAAKDAWRRLTTLFAKSLKS